MMMMMMMTYNNGHLKADWKPA